MGIHFLDHHRAFCENLARLNQLDVSWDGRGAIPLRKKALQSAVEIFGRRPDLAIGATVVLSKGGLNVSILRGGRDVNLVICPLGTVRLSRHLPRSRPDLEIFVKLVDERLIDALRDVIAFFEDPFLDRARLEDHQLAEPFEGFDILRLHAQDSPEEKTILFGRRTYAEGIYAFHEMRELPADIFRDQVIYGQTRLSELLASYHEDLTPDPEPV